MRAFLKREITHAEAMAFISHDTADALHDYPVRPYARPAADLLDYIGSRAQGLVKREQKLAVANGIFLAAIFATLLQNRHDLDYLRDAEARCRESKSDAAADKIKAHIAEHERNVFPSSLYNEARLVQRLDADERGLDVPRK